MKYISDIATLSGISVPILIALVVLAAVVGVLYVTVGIASGRGSKWSIGGLSFGMDVGGEDVKGAEDGKPQAPGKKVKGKDGVPEHPGLPPEHGSTPMCAVVRTAAISRTRAVIMDHITVERSLQVDILRQQMNYAEESIASLRVLLCDCYAEALSVNLNLGFSESKNTPQYRSYRMLLSYILLERVKDPIIKRAVVENHFLDMNPLEFDQYCIRKTGMVIDTMSDALDQMYQDISQVLTRADVFYINDMVLFDSRAILKGIFEHAREVARTYSAKIEENRALMDSKLLTLGESCS